MIKNSLVFLLTFIVLSVSAQDVRYYKLSRIRQNGIDNKNVSGGQFITFIGDICYESNKKGIGVNHGTLTKNTHYSNSQYSVYQGSSYWGEQTEFKFNADKSVLNVLLNNGDIYVYKQTTPPAGQETCSLIRQPDTNTGSSGNYAEGYTPTPNYPEQPYNTTSSPNSRPTSEQKVIQEQVQCSRCKGTGKMDIDTYPPDFGGPDPEVWCSIRGRYYRKSRGHNHVTCTECKGTGTVTRTRVQ